MEIVLYGCAWGWREGAGEGVTRQDRQEERGATEEMERGEEGHLSTQS